MYRKKRKRGLLVFVVFLMLYYIHLMVTFAKDNKQGQSGNARTNLFHRKSINDKQDIHIRSVTEASMISTGNSRNKSHQLNKLDVSANLSKDWKNSNTNEFHVNRWTNLQNLGKLRSFRPKLDERQYLAMISMWRDFTSFCKTMGFPFILYGGTLIGSYRHHGFIPWDDDLDVLMNVSYRQRIFQRFSQLPGYQIIPMRWGSGYYYKFFKLPKGMERTKQYEGVWRFFWPFVDIFFFGENATHITDISWAKPSVEIYSWEKDKYFPLQRRPLEGEMHSVPCNIEYVMRAAKYGDPNSVCVSSWYDHINSKALNSTAVYCQELYEFYPFVKRNVENGIVRETLTLNQTILSTHDFEDNCKQVT